MERDNGAQPAGFQLLSQCDRFPITQPLLSKMGLASEEDQDCLKSHQQDSHSCSMIRGKAGLQVDSGRCKMILWHRGNDIEPRRSALTVEFPLRRPSIGAVEGFFRCEKPYDCLYSRINLK
jgi:hypothetical protein